MVHAVFSLPHFCIEQHHPLPSRGFLNSTLPAADGGVGKAHRDVPSCIRAMVIRRVGRNAHGQRNDARLCRDAIFPQSQAAIPEGVILNRNVATDTSDWLKRRVIDRCIKPIQLAPTLLHCNSWLPTTNIVTSPAAFCHHWPKSPRNLLLTSDPA